MRGCRCRRRGPPENRRRQPEQQVAGARVILRESARVLLAADLRASGLEAAPRDLGHPGGVAIDRHERWIEATRVREGCQPERLTPRRNASWFGCVPAPARYVLTINMSAYILMVDAWTPTNPLARSPTVPSI